MVDFLRSFAPLLDRSTRRGLVLAALGATGVAAIEALGLVLVLPLVQTITQAATGVIPPSAHLVADRMSHPTPLRVAAVIGLIVFVAFVTKGLASVLFIRWSMRFVLEAEVATSTRLLTAYLYAPFAYHLTRNSAELQRNVHHNVRQVYQDAVVAFVGGAADAILIIAIAAVLVVLEPTVAVCSAAYFALVGAGYQRLIHGRARAAGDEIQRNVGASYRVVQQSIGAIKDVQIGHSQRVFVDELERIKRASARRFRTLLLLNQAPRYYLEIAMIIGVGLMATLLYPLRSISGATAALSLFLASGFRLLPSLNRVLVALSAIRANQPALDEVTGDLLELESTDRPEDTDRRALGPVAVSFERVAFAYSPDLGPVLDGVSFVIEPGESVAIVGASGAGKSTLLDLMLGLLDPTEGAIRIGGTALPTVRGRWQRSIGYVPQDVVLLDEPLRSNVALGVRPDDIDEARVWRALAMAELAEAVHGLPEGLETRLGERGVRLSGGQRQRVGIARALYREPGILVLDEATSSLDAGVERRITETIESLHGHVTLVVVTHRLSTVRHADRIYFIESGAVAAVGAFDELVATNAAFRELSRLSGTTATSDGPGESHT